MSASDSLPPLPPPQSRTKTLLIAGLVVVLAYFAGVASGAAVHRMLFRVHGGGRLPAFGERMIVNHLDRRLDLTGAQRHQIETIVRRRHTRLFRMWQTVRPQVQAEIDAANRDIESVLTPKQRAKFQKMKIRVDRPPFH